MATINKNAMKSFYALGLARIGLGLIFLWAFFDKLFGLGFATCRDKMDAVHVACSQAWLHGGSPTTGFLAHATQGPLAGFYHHFAGQGWVDWLFMGGLLVIGLGLTLGVWVRLASALGVIMLALMWSSLLWPAQNPLLDEHIIYICVLLAVNLGNSQQRFGLRGWWTETRLVKAAPILE